MTRSLIVDRIQIRNFRNLRQLALEPAPRVNVIGGDNGQGKTSVLEALYVVLTSRSFRAERLATIILQGAEQASCSARIHEDDLIRTQRAVLQPRARSLFVNDKRAQRLSDFATQTPVVVFHPGDLELVSGAAAGRRTLLDRIALYQEPVSADERLRYVKAQRERQRALQERGPQTPELDAYERLMADHGATLTAARERAAQTLALRLLPIFERMAAPNLQLAIRYAPGGSTDPALNRERLGQHRHIDLRRRSASFGPHRDEFGLELEGRSAREHASQGQQRILTLALKAAELECVRDARGVEPLLLLDDVSSELDPTRTGAVYEFLRETRSQLFVTTTRPELFLTPGVEAPERVDFRLLGGELCAPESS